MLILACKKEKMCEQGGVLFDTDFCIPKAQVYYVGYVNFKCLKDSIMVTFPDTSRSSANLYRNSSSTNMGRWRSGSDRIYGFLRCPYDASSTEPRNYATTGVSVSYSDVRAGKKTIPARIYDATLLGRIGPHKDSTDITLSLRSVQ